MGRRKIHRLSARLSAWIFSTAVHFCCILFLAVEAVPFDWQQFWSPAGAKDSLVLEAQWGEVKPESLAISISVADPQAAQKIPLATSSLPVQSQIAMSSSQSLARSANENLAELKSSTQQLEKISSQQSVEQMVQVINGVLGTAARATSPAPETVAGDFDFSTAQFEDVRKVADENGLPTYSAVLVDAAGRTTHAPLTVEEGAQIYQVMQIVKSSPLLESIYRGVLMGYLDKLLKSQSQ
jgi:hypothetical protein